VIVCFIDIGGVKPVIGIPALPLFTSNDNICMAFLNLEGPKYSSNQKRTTNLSEQEIFTCKINSTAFLNVMLPNLEEQLILERQKL
jgi:hypothetical protein